MIVIAVDLIALKVDNPFKKKYQYLVENSDKIKILLLGNSHIAQNIDETSLSPYSLNMAVGGSGFCHHKAVADKFIPLLTDLNTIIINLDYIPEVDTSMKHKEIKPIDVSWGKKMNFLHSAYWNVYDGVINKSAFLSNQIKPQINGTNNRFVGTLKDTTYHPKWWRSSEIGKISIEEYEENINEISFFAQLCSKNGFRLIVLTAPVSDELCMRIKESQILKMQYLMDSISAQYPFEYRNYLCDEQFGSDRTLVIVLTSIIEEQPCLRNG